MLQTSRDQKLPESLGIAVLGYQNAPNPGCCKNMERGGDGTSYTPEVSADDSQSAPAAADMSRDVDGEQKNVDV